MENDNSPIQSYLWIPQTYNLARNCSIALKPSCVFAFADSHALIQFLHEACFFFWEKRSDRFRGPRVRLFFSLGHYKRRKEQSPIGRQLVNP